MRTDRFTIQVLAPMMLNVIGISFLLLLLLISGYGQVLGSATLWGFQEETIGEDTPPPAARQNAILRAYFREQYLNLRTERYDLNETFMERYVDRQIDSFLEDIDSRLKALRYSLEEVERAYNELSRATNSGTKREDLTRLATLLKEIDNNAGGLRGKLLNVFIQLDGKENLPIKITSADDYRKEMKFLREQVDEAEKRIREYLFQNRSTVPYQDLKRENMIIRLYWAEKTAEGIRDRIRR